MPAMSGFEFLDEFKKFDIEVQQQFVIYMLSSSIEDFNSQAKKYPIVADFLSKPLKSSHLEKILNRSILWWSDGVIMWWFDGELELIYKVSRRYSQIWKSQNFADAFYY